MKLLSRSSKKITFKRIIFSILGLLIFTSCGKEQEKSDKATVYTSFYPVYDMAKMIGGDSLDIKSFMPLDKDPHLWEPSPKDMKKLSEADLLIVNGANMEPWIDTVKKNLPELEILKLSDSVDLITYKGAAALGDFQYMAKLSLDKGKNKIDFGHTHEDMMRVAFLEDDGTRGEDLVKKAKDLMAKKGELINQKSENTLETGKVYGIEMGHESGEVFFDVEKPGDYIFIADRISEDLLPYNLVGPDGKFLKDVGKESSLMQGSSSGFDKITYDPHSWLSITNGKKYLNAIQEKFIERFPQNERLYKKNKLKYVDKLTDLDAKYKELFSGLADDRKNFLTLHYAYAYLARDFGLNQYPIHGLTSLESPSLKTIKKAVEFSDAKNISTVFYEYGKNPKEAKALAEEIGGHISPLASMEYKIDEDKEAYISLMELNLNNLYESMKGGKDD